MRLITGLCVLLMLYFASIQIPLAGPLVGTLIPLPIVLVCRRVGWWSGFYLVLVAGGAVFYLERFFHFPNELIHFLELALIGLLLALFIIRGYSADRAIAFTVLVAAGIGGLVFVGRALSLGVTPFEFLAQTIEDLVKGFMAFLGKEGIPPDKLVPEGLSVSDLTQLLVQISPALWLINTTLVVWLNMILSREIWRHATGEDPGPPLNLWKSPEWLVFITLGAGFGLLVPMAWVPKVALNILLLCGLIYFYQGLAIVAFVFHRCQVPRVIRALGYPLLLLKPVALLVIGVGLVDLWFDFRRLHPPPSQA
ncbi:MAG: DUF2232 domain-containing protein [Desulfobacteraceae bacterium]